MIVKCEKCGKKYKIDETKIVGGKAHIKCKSCQNIFEIIKEEKYVSENLDSIAPKKDTEPKKKTADRKKSSTGSSPKNKHGKKQSGFGGLTIGIKFSLIFLISVIITAATLTFVYFKYIPSLVFDHVAIRTRCISLSASTAVKHPLLVRDYLRINQVAETNSKLPDVAYVSVSNKKGIVVAGIFDNLERFSASFITSVKTQGFPRELPLKNFIPQGKKESSKRISVGGQEIYDVAVTIGETGGVIHVGTFVEDNEKRLNQSMKPLVINLITLAIIGSLLFLIAAKIITQPIKKLANEASRISNGEISKPVAVKGSGEVKVIATALEEIRSSIQSAAKH